MTDGELGKHINVKKKTVVKKRFMTVQEWWYQDVSQQKVNIKYTKLCSPIDQYKIVNGDVIFAPEILRSMNRCLVDV